MMLKIDGNYTINYINIQTEYYVSIRYNQSMTQTPKTVSKLVIIDSQDQYLMMWRSEHPTYGTDPDLPGGTLDGTESPLETMLREVEEEAGVTVEPSAVTQVYNGADYSGHGTHYVLYAARVFERPGITMSWEHSSYQWVSKDEFVSLAKSANDTYMHMVGDVIAARSE